MLRYFLTAFVVVCVALLAIAGWQGKISKDTPMWGHKEFNNMEYQSRYRSLGEAKFEGWTDGREARPPVAGTVSRSTLVNEQDVFSGEYVAALQRNVEFATGKDAAGKFVTGFPKNSLKPDGKGGFLPYVVNHEVLELGRKKFDIYCAICHGPAADGNGVMKKRGANEGDEAIGAIADLQGATYRAYPNGQVYDVIAHGAKTMLSYGDKLNPEERWAVVAYLRALQLSQNCPKTLVPSGVDTANLK